MTLRALAKEPSDRYQDAHAFAKALEAALLEAEGRITDAGNPRTGILAAGAACSTHSGRSSGGDCGAAAIGGGSGRITSRCRVQRPSPMATVSADVLEAPKSGAPLLGRDDAMAFLEERRRESEAQFVVAHVVGEEGSGKTRLVTEFLGRCAARRDEVLTVGPDPTWAKIRDETLRNTVRALAGLPEGPVVDKSRWAKRRRPGPARARSALRQG